MRFGLPVFVAPAVERVSARLESVTRDGDALAVRVRNTGNVHVVVDSVSVDGGLVDRRRYLSTVDFEDAVVARSAHTPSTDVAKRRSRPAMRVSI